MDLARGGLVGGADGACTLGVAHIPTYLFVTLQTVDEDHVLRRLSEFLSLLRLSFFLLL